MKIPKKLKVGGHIYDVECPYAFTEIGSTKGQLDPESKVIKIDPLDYYSHKERPESSVAVTFLHEILHACDHVTGHSVFLGHEGEKIVEGISEVLFQVLRDNRLKFYED